ncbi:MAG: Holliday junction branch migration protein RuvA [Actinobacteria bacterium]|jgi:holliday junction DNA helicase RuvA|nr:Holliday junction branch migration protein RuvA [Actinomycetota bacterium]NBP53009.1 Holliday junction branch migration protein RuvA [Actinomycetota bacterium]
MIGSLRGTVIERIVPSTVLVEVAGVGYLVTVTPRVFAELEPTTSCFLYVHHHIREDAQTLYGFTGRDERECFNILLGAHGIGPAMALAILGTHSPRGLHHIIITSDLGALTMVPGVGKKTAERLLVELRGKFDAFDTSPAHGSTVSGESVGRSSPVADLREALLGLGYGNDEIRDVMSELSPADGAALDQMLRDALAILGARRA